MKPTELRDKLLAEAGEILDQYIKVAKGEGEFTSTNSAARAEVWGLIKNVIKNAPDKTQIANGGSPEAIIKAVEMGLITPDDGAKLIQLYKRAKEIEYIGKEPAKAGAGGFTIIVQSGEQNVAFDERSLQIEGAAPIGGPDEAQVIAVANNRPDDPQK